MIAALKTAVARRPLLVFLVLAIVPYVVVTAVTSQDLVSGYQSPIIGLAALFCCWAMSDRREQSRHLLARLAIVFAVTFAILLLSAVQVRLFSGEYGPNQSLQEVMASRMRDGTFWANAVVAGIVLSGVLSRSTMVRRLAQDLIGWRFPRPLLAVALAAPAVAAVLAVLLERVFPAQGGSAISFRLPPTYFLAGFFLLLLFFLSPAFALYGFARERLVLRMSPLLAALAIGLVTQLPQQVMGVVIPLLHHEPQHYGLTNALDLAYPVAIAVTAVWLVEKGRGSLLPTTLFLALTSVAIAATFSWGGMTFEDKLKSGDIYSWVIVVLALVLAFSGRMWRRPHSEDADGLTVDQVVLQISP